MANVKPFKAIRPNRAEADKIAALPYDVYNRQEAKEVVATNPLSFLRIDRAETNFADSVDTYDECVYQKAHDLLWEQVEEDHYIREQDDCFYVYELTMDGRVQTGIVGCASVDDYENAVIKKHENTRAEKEADRIHHVDTVSAQTGPIFLAYRNRDAIDEVVARTKENEAEYDFTADDGIRHRVFVISNPDDIAVIKSEFADTNEIYIADGHHRAASAVKVSQKRRAENPDYTGDEEFNYFLSVFFPDNQLMIMDYNRVVTDLNGLHEEEFLEKLEVICSLVSESASPMKPIAKYQFSMYMHGTWRLYSIRDRYLSADPVDGLDVSLLQDLVLQPILGIDDPKTDVRIDFVGGIRGLEELERRCSEDMEVAFAMYPTSIHELFAVADAGLLMPPKSTWFEPKLRSGLFIHEI